MDHIGLSRDPRPFRALGPGDRGRSLWRRHRRWVLRGLGGLVLLSVVLGGVALIERAPAQRSRPVTLVSGSWEPFIGPDLVDNGPVARVVVEALQRQGFNPRLQFASWDIAAERVEDDEAFGTFPFIASEDRRNRFHLSESIIEFDYVMFYRSEPGADPPTVDDAADIRRLRVGRVSGYEVWEELDEAVDTFVELPTTEAAFAALADGEIDLLPEGRLPGRAIVEAPDFPADAGTIGVLPADGNPLLSATETLHMLVPRTDDARRFLDGFNAALAEVKAGPLFAEAVSALDAASRAERVELVPTDGDSLVDLHATESGPVVASAPLGTTAEVLQWPEGFTPGSTEPSVDRVSVKILNGPTRGRIFYIDAAAVRLSEATP